MSLISSVWSGIQGGFPRVSGDEPSLMLMNNARYTVFPA